MNTLANKPSKGFKWVIFDIDGVLADNLHRVPLMHQKRYEEYYGPLVLKDTPIVDNIEIVDSYRRLGYFVSLWTARNEISRQYTIEWLNINRVPFDELRMRPSKDHRRAHLVKADWLTEELASGFKPIAVFDDDPANIENYKKHDITAIFVTTLGKHPYRQEIKHHANVINTHRVADEHQERASSSPEYA